MNIKKSIKEKIVDIIPYIIIIAAFLYLGIQIKNEVYFDGYKNGQLDYQKNIVVWKLDDGQIWKLESK